MAFKHSFRSGTAILQSVDHVFRDETIYRSIHAENAYPLHEALPDAGPSLIDLWALELPDPRQDIEGWRAPFDAVSETSPEVRLARRIQAEIKSLIAAGTMTGSADRRRALSYGDVLVLVRRRGNAFDAVIQALKHANIPVAGADRLKLTEHIAIIDLMNLADALLLPQDDLALAVALKSPLFGLIDDDLFKLAWQRKGSLRIALVHHAATDKKFEAALARLKACETRARQETPFAFYAWLLGGAREGGRARILRRLGHEANDALDEFLELALGYERKAPASLQGFMAWLRAADTEVKRDMEISRDEVRVMTVHGAKGLEAPVVFLVDTTTSPADTTRLKLVRMPQGNAAPHAPGVVVWAGKKAEDPPAVAAAREAMLGETEDEYRRLLYVAMTRAADRLDHRRLHAGQPQRIASVVVVRPDRKGPRQFRLAHAERAAAGRRGETLFAGRGCERSGGRGVGASLFHRYPLACMAAHARSARTARRTFPAAVRSCRGRSGIPQRRGGAIARTRVAARQAGAPAAAIAAGCPLRRPAARRRCAISPAMPTNGPRTSARRSPHRCCR